jgi:FkbM family methyltransferase
MNSAIVYDVGMNNGDDSRYYLDKGYRVVGIDANPDSCRACEIRFAPEIAANRMRVLNTGVGRRSETLDFYVNKRESPISTFSPRDLKSAPNEWLVINVPVRPLSMIIQECGAPVFVKVDVEYFDHLVLHDLLEAGIKPPFISAEAQSIDVFCALVLMGYQQFKLVHGATVGDVYANHTISRLNQSSTQYSFPNHSSGPYGEDIPGDWMDKNAILLQLLKAGLGWIDLHARI